MQIQHLPTPAPGPVISNSLRSEMDRRRTAGTLFDIKQAIAIVVPLCTDAAQRHARGERFFIHPSSILIDSAGYPYVAPELAGTVPTLPRDRACLAPEEKHTGQPGNARASVFAIGAILYELITGEAVGPGMRRPTQVVPNLNPAVETILGKALVGDATHRPDDLGALAQALHHLAPTASVAPPAADESRLDGGDDFAVDISLSLMPPAPPGSAPKVVSSQGLVVPTITNSSPDPYAMVVKETPRPILPPDDPTARLADLKARLEADPRPRYVVIKDGMDHGPFNAVELLTQIGTHAFEGHHILRDTVSNDELPIEEWEEFSPFAEHAKLHREIVAEKKAIARVVVEEAKGTRTKTIVGVVGLAVILSVIGIWFFKVRGARKDTIDVQGENGIAVESAGGLKGASRKTGGGRATMGPGGIPILSGGMSCEAARAKYVEEISIGGPKGQADLTANQFGAVLNNGAYIVACGTPQSMHVNVCAAIQNGRAVGVTVTTDPPSGGIAGCIAGKVRGMSFPSNPKLDIATTRF
jgi:eukaryotic-like serine/threonine-protein kinase